MWISSIVRTYFVVKREVASEVAVEIEGEAGGTSRDRLGRQSLRLNGQRALGVLPASHRRGTASHTAALLSA